MMEPYQNAFIEMALTHQVLRFGEFKLKSGRVSPYFFNVGQLSTGLALKTLGECYADAIQKSGISYDALFGPAYKGIPLVCASAIALQSLHQREVPFAFNRKEAKDHGEGGIIVGAPIQNRRVLIIDDVITAGTALKEAFEILTKAKAVITGVVIALDRQEKGQYHLSAIQEIESQFKIKVNTIINFSHIIEFVSKSPDFYPYLNKLQQYRQEYGIES